MTDPGERRRRTLEAGHRGETIATLLLILKGYQILARRYAVAGGEIDIVARRGTLILFVEVKRRPTIAEAMAAITPHKQRRIERAAAVWLSRHPWAANLDFRADAILVTPRGWPRHVPDAFALAIG